MPKVCEYLDNTLSFTALLIERGSLYITTAKGEICLRSTFVYPKRCSTMEYRAYVTMCAIQCLHDLDVFWKYSKAGKTDLSKAGAALVAAMHLFIDTGDPELPAMLNKHSNFTNNQPYGA